MVITEMNPESCIALLTRVRLGRLACAHEGQPYITPMFWMVEGDYLYSFSTQGQKIDWMRQNPRVCVEFEEVSTTRDWATVIILGRFEELPDDPEHSDARRRPYHLLSTRPDWWEPGYVKTALAEGIRPMEPLYLRVRIAKISGHHTAAPVRA